MGAEIYSWTSYCSVRCYLCIIFSCIIFFVFVFYQFHYFAICILFHYTEHLKKKLYYCFAPFPLLTSLIQYIYLIFNKQF